MRCSKRCAKPRWFRSSFLEPTWYQRFVATSGSFRWRRRRTLRPLSRVTWEKSISGNCMGWWISGKWRGSYTPPWSQGHKGEADQVVLNAERFSLYFPATRGSKAPAALQIRMVEKKRCSLPFLGSTILYPEDGVGKMA